MSERHWHEMSWRELEQSRRLLGLGKKASLEEVRRAYRSLAREYHPDSCPLEEQQQCAEKMAAITVAYKRIVAYMSRFEVPLERTALRRYGPNKDMQRFAGIWEEDDDGLTDI